MSATLTGTKWFVLTAVLLLPTLVVGRQAWAETLPPTTTGDGRNLTDADIKRLADQLRKEQEKDAKKKAEEDKKKAEVDKLDQLKLEADQKKEEELVLGVLEEVDVHLQSLV